MFATLCMISVHPDRDHRLGADGRPPAAAAAQPRWRRELPTLSAAPLGLSEVRDWPGTQIRLDGSWSILLYTDGLIEGRIGKGSERLGSEGLMDLIRESPAPRTARGRSCSTR